MFEEFSNSILEKIPSFKGEISKSSFNPSRDWAISLLVALLVTVAFVFWGGSLFLEINKESTSEGVEKTNTINRSLLTEVLEVYREKNTNFEVLQKSLPKTIDPSL